MPQQLSLDIEKLILDGTLKAGDRLPPERDLGEMLGVSRVSTREALSELESRGLIDRKPGRGTVVVSAAQRGGSAGRALSALRASTDAETIQLSQVMEVRGVVEPPIAAMATARVTERDIAQLQALVEVMETEINLQRYAELDRAFHQAISEYTHNPLLAQLTEIIFDQLDPSRRQALLSRERRDTSTVGHRRIFEAIARGDSEAAEAEAHDHIESVLLEALKAQQRPDLGTSD